MGRERLAQGKKNASRLGAHILFVDESGFMLIPPVRRTWAPKGSTPITVHRFSHSRVSAISAVSVSPVNKRLSLYYHLSRDNIRSADVAFFVRELLRTIPGHIIVLWDNSVTHRGALVRELDRTRERLHIEYFPAYAPELNPDERVWSQLKELLANGRPDDVAELEDHLLSSLVDIRSSQSRLRACVHKSDLPLF
ncbi:MAG: IS630 family transposase [Actinobacteria bacterium]|nr:IS630 family transposase [Actinomycetota bacterium]MBU2687279.1 IS630 family transposase [Actinomycetota bacterium]